MPGLFERIMGRPIRDNEWWVWWLALPLLYYAWPLILIYFVGRFALDVINYTPSERRMRAIGTAKANSQVPVGDVYIPVGPEHNRPVSEWWDTEADTGNLGVRKGSGFSLELNGDDAIKMGSALLLAFLLIFLLLGGSGWAFIFSLIFTGGFSFAFYRIATSEPEDGEQAMGHLGTGHNRPESEWWELEAIPVGTGHNRPESEWWDIEVGGDVTKGMSREQVLAERLVYSLTFLAVFAGTLALEGGFWTSLIVTSSLIVFAIMYKRMGLPPWGVFMPF